MATISVELLADQWTVIGTGAGLLENNQTEDAIIHFGDAEPTDPYAHHVLQNDKSLEIFSGSQTIYGRPRTAGKSARVVFTDLA